MACPLGNSQSLESQSGLYSAIRNRLTTQSKPDLRYGLDYKYMNLKIETIDFTAYMLVSSSGY